PDDIYKLLLPYFKNKKQEIFVVVCLNNANKVLRIILNNIGGKNGCMIEPTSMWRKAIEVEACHIIMAHNHPSGEVIPSREDDELTKRIKKGGNELNIGLLDHMIITDGKYYSYSKEGKL
ncbi:MAG: hypothetical protein D6752_07085, partial [Candidatus Nitrosothermus koennekii]